MTISFGSACIYGKESSSGVFPFLYAVAILGMVQLVPSPWNVARGGISHYWIFLAFLTIITSALAIKIPGIDFRISIEDTFFFTNLILFGPAAGCLTAALQGLIGSIRIKSISRRLEFTLFNIGALVISAWISGHLLFGVLKSGPLFKRPQLGLFEIMLPMAVTGIVHYLANSGSVAAIIALDARKSIYKVWP